VAARILALPGGDPERRLRAAEAAGGLAYWRGDFPAAVEQYEAVLEGRRRLGPEAEVANALYNLAFPVLFARNRDDRAHALATEAVERYRALGDETGLAAALWLLGNVHMFRGELEEASRSVDEALAILDRSGGFLRAWAVYTRAQVDARTGDLAAASDRQREALERFAAIPDMSGLSLVLDGIATTAWLRGDRLTAARLSGAVAHLEATTGTGLNIANRTVFGFEPRSLLDTPETTEAWRIGERLPVETIVAEVLTGQRGDTEAAGRPVIPGTMRG
jgi:tetratricopeptide (TPR) repeat protein